MNVVANFTLEPLLFVDIDRDRGISAFGDAAAAAGVAVCEVGSVLNDVESSTVGSDNALAM